MKKTYFVAAAVALAVFFAGCDGFLTPPEADNEEGLKISFKTTDGSRALTTPIAAAGADYFEVIFTNGTRTVRTSWGGGAQGRIIPGNGDYDNTVGPGKGRAYIFAGRNSTLLGVGVLTAVIPDPTLAPQSATATTIDMAYATEVVFTITALNTDVGGLLNPANPPANAGDPPNSDPALSTFTIELEPGDPFSGNMVGALLLDASQDPPLTAPVFVVNPSPTGLDATFNITNTNGANLPAGILSAIISKGTPRAIYSGYLWEAGGAPLALTTADITNNLTAGAPLVLPITLDVIPGEKAGLARLSIEIPVVLFADAQADNGAKPVAWYIRGGLNNTLHDQGAAFSDGDGSLGGAIIIGVGEYNKNAAGLIVSPKF